MENPSSDAAEPEKVLKSITNTNDSLTTANDLPSIYKDSITITDVSDSPESTNANDSLSIYKEPIANIDYSNAPESTNVNGSRTDSNLSDSAIITKLSIVQKFVYAVGLGLNSLTVTMWSTYTLVYFNSVHNFNDKYSGGLVIWGQVIVGVVTPIVGFVADKGKCSCPFGRRKTWHLIGTICVAVGFPFLFMECFNCTNASQGIKFGYYAVFTTVFLCGWCAVEISHVSLSTDLTAVASERVELNSLRYGVIVVSSIIVYSAMWIFLKDSALQGKRLGPADSIAFQNVALIITGIGIFFAILFYLFLKEKPDDSEHDTKSQLKWSDWFKERQFYMIAFLYLPTKLYFTMSIIYMPLYIQMSLQLRKDNIAILPLVMLVSGFVASCFMKYLTIYLGNKLILLISCIVGLTAALWILFARGESYNEQQIYVVGVMMGFVKSVFFIISLAMTADLISNSIKSGAFVFGFMSFLDRIGNGIVVLVISSLNPCGRTCEGSHWYYRNVMSYGLGVPILWTLVALAIIRTQEIGIRLQKPKVQKGTTNVEIEVDNTPKNT